MRSLVFCTTCGFCVEGANGPGGPTGGETLARAAAAERRLFVARMSAEGGAEGS